MVVVGGFFAINGCGARGKVAMDKVTTAVDRMLGELEVKRQQISDKLFGVIGKSTKPPKGPRTRRESEVVLNHCARTGN